MTRTTAGAAVSFAARATARRTTSVVARNLLANGALNIASASFSVFVRNTSPNLSLALVRNSLRYTASVVFGANFRFANVLGNFAGDLTRNTFVFGAADRFRSHDANFLAACYRVAFGNPVGAPFLDTTSSRCWWAWLAGAAWITWIAAAIVSERIHTPLQTIAQGLERSRNFAVDIVTTVNTARLHDSYSLGFPMRTHNSLLNLYWYTVINCLDNVLANWLTYHDGISASFANGFCNTFVSSVAFFSANTLVASAFYQVSFWNAFNYLDGSHCGAATTTTVTTARSRNTVNRCLSSRRFSSGCRAFSLLLFLGVSHCAHHTTSAQNQSETNSSKIHAFSFARKHRSWG